MKKHIFILLSAIIMCTSCVSRKKYVYVNDMKPGKNYPVEEKYESKMQSGDFLNITVSCKTPELAMPFNINTGAFNVDAAGNVLSSQTASAANRYRVDVNGNIYFPILGELMVVDLTVNELKNLIKNKIVDGGYIKDPIITIEFLNFKISVLGEVGSVGVYTIDDDKITLFEAIAKAGDLTRKARKDRVIVIREEQGVRKQYVHDMRKMDVFNSPAFYLKQNDIVYVEPKYRKTDREDSTMKYTTLLLSIVSTMTTVMYWTTR